MFYSMQSPLALYRAFKAANVPDDIARDAAYAVSADLEAMIDQLVTELESRCCIKKRDGNVTYSDAISGRT